MPLILDISEEDVKRGKIIDPGTYRFEVKDVFKARNSAGTGDNVVVDLLGLEGNAEDVMVRTWIPVSQPFRLIPWVVAGGGTVPEKGTQVDMEALKGKQIKASCKPGLYNDKMTNQIGDVFPAD